MTTLKQIVSEELSKQKDSNPQFELSLRNRLKNKGITDESIVKELIAAFDEAMIDGFLKQNGSKLIALIPDIAKPEIEKICGEVANMLKEAGVEAQTELIAELTSTT